MSKVIQFYSEKEKWGEFSNFYPSLLFIDGIEYPTSEHCYQASKFMGSKQDQIAHKEYIKLISKQSTPGKSKILANQHISGGYKWRTDLNVYIKSYYEQGVRIRDDWMQVKDNIMRKVLYYKFSTNSKLKTVLTSTGDSLLVEHTTRDYYWGDGDGTGKNMLGKILVETRGLVCNVYSKIPTPTSNWIIPGILISSDYPSRHKGDFEIYCKVGINLFINLMGEQELEDSEKLYKILPYKTNDKTLNLVKCPIPDKKVLSDEKALKLAKMIVKNIGIGKKILVHCLGGKGRTGTILGIVLGLIYNMNYSEILNILSKSFCTRLIKGRYPKMPQTRVQLNQIKRVTEALKK